MVLTKRGQDKNNKSREYDYVWIAKQYQRLSLYPRIVGLSASPGSDLEKITEVCKNLFIEDIEVRTDEDPDLKPYIYETKVDYLEIELPKDFKEAIAPMEQFFSAISSSRYIGRLPNK